MQTKASSTEKGNSGTIGILLLKEFRCLFGLDLQEKIIFFFISQSLYINMLRSHIPNSNSQNKSGYI